MYSQSLPSSNTSSKFMPISEIFNIKNTKSQPYKTPIKHSFFQNQNNNSTPFQFNFSQFFGNLFSNEKIQNQSTEKKNQSSIKKINESNYLLYKPSFDKSNYKFTPEYNFNSSIEKKNISDNEDNLKNELGKKNLFEIFNSVKNEFFLSNSKKEKSPSSINEKNNQFLFCSPRNNIKKKKIFECSGSTNNTNNSTLKKKRKRFKKNSEQLKLLSLFYSKNKQWNKQQIKKISQETGLKENKVYKWLWDQRNKEYKTAKFIIINN